MRPGVRIALDAGERRIGVARCDSHAILSVPEGMVPRDAQSITAIAALVREHGAMEVIVGLPLGMSGTEGPAAASARVLAGELARALDPVPVRLVDERLSTVQAQRSLHAAGRTTRTSRSVIDSAAAVVILEAALDVERATGTPPGEAADPGGPTHE